MRPSAFFAWFPIAWGEGVGEQDTEQTEAAQLFSQTNFLPPYCSQGRQHHLISEAAAFSYVRPKLKSKLKCSPLCILSDFPSPPFPEVPSLSLPCHQFGSSEKGNDF